MNRNSLRVPGQECLDHKVTTVKFIQLHERDIHGPEAIKCMLTSKMFGKSRQTILMRDLQRVDIVPGSFVNFLSKHTVRIFDIVHFFLNQTAKVLRKIII